MLVMVIIVTAVGLLFGAGALLLFRYQCQQRIDRQHEMEKVYAVRSALNFIRAYTKEIGDDGISFRYHTGSDRNLGLLVKPVSAIFPNSSDPGHFDMRTGDFRYRPKQYDRSRDYEYGVRGTNLVEESIRGISSEGNGSMKGLAFGDLNAITNVRWWVNIGMRNTGGWLQEDYGRRYYFKPWSYVDGEVGGVKDIMRLCIIRNLTNEFNAAGSRHGWPLSQHGERALVFQITPMSGGMTSGKENTANEIGNAEMTLSEYVYRDNGHLEITPLICQTNTPSLCYMGFQLAADKVSLFYVSNKGNIPFSTRGYTFSDAVSISRGTYKYFAEDVEVGGRKYGGIFTNDVGLVQAPELRAVIEVEAASGMRDGRQIDSSNENVIENFMVTPAFQYDVFVEHPLFVTNRATVAQKIGEYIRGNLAASFSVRTYDTHGTEHKGFRRDEREAERRGR